MTRRAVYGPLIAALGLLGCKAHPIGAGEACTRSSECEKGLVCVEGMCGDDLASLGSPGTVPMLTPDAGPPAAQQDASPPPSPEAGPADSGAPADGG